MAIVTHDLDQDAITEDGIPIVSTRRFHSAIVRVLLKFYRVLHWGEMLLVRLYKPYYRRRTGRKEPDPWEPYFVENVLKSFAAAKAAKTLRPRFVFGHEAGCYGLPSAYCKDVPSFLFPWGADVFLSAETSPVYFRLIRYALHNVDLVLPSSVTAAKHITARFGVASDKVIPVSWGADFSLFQRASAQNRRHILERFSIPSDAFVICNPRRFRPAWGCFAALDAFMALAEERADLHFVMVGGAGTEAHVESALLAIEQRGLLSRFTILQEDIPITVFADLMSIADVFVSLLGRGDMRSSSVLQAAAAGAVPVIVDNPEYQEMTRCGFMARLISSADPVKIADAVKSYLHDPDYLHATRETNYEYLQKNEDARTQMAHMLDLIQTVCLEYERGCA
ncbi:glycosyltransferase family 4 protein [Geomonas sp. RF6]|uniref:glycosyltransferase family 4 protein n=1 Tax=Geomonas sp. RF6 TaxID=2897342 RepID=UPI001E2DB323|nr:glycosyltransferase family 4 protein [Geomonas sp. RF6]UFS72700.1 glycosyltransferase family 4 protein [Geomonas sp. RF6]